jgi:tetratricopeptide (TPR) repeat protein
MRLLIVLSFAFITAHLTAQVNCNVYKYNGDEACYKACVAYNKGEQLAQGSRESQVLFDEAIKHCPNFDYAWMEKSVPYLKNGDFVNWKKLIDEAVRLNPSGHLGYRGWCRFQFLRDYKGAIRDIELLDSIRQYDIGYSVNGDYHLKIALALCYKMIGQKEKAIGIIERQLAVPDYSVLPFDYLHLGVLKLETGDIVGAIATLQKQIEFNDYLAETYYYLSQCYERKADIKESLSLMEKAKTFYLKKYRRQDPYTHPIDKIYLSDIEEKLAILQRR